jgi:hypothetical protein
MAVVVAMCMYKVKFWLLKFYLFPPDLRRINRKNPVEIAPVAITPITPAAPVERRGLSMPLNQ